MKTISIHLFTILTLFTFLVSCKQAPKKENKTQIRTEEIQKDPLSSWNDTSSKKEIMAYVDAVTDKNNSHFIPVADRIAVFDCDGTLWSEQPDYFQFLFTLDQIKKMAADHPEWKNKQPYKAVLENDMKTLMKSGENGLMKLLMSTHTGITTDEFKASVKEWIKTAKHPTKKVAYDKLVYQPMLELLNFLRANNFKTYIVTGSGTDFIRAIVTDIYGIPEEQIIGSRFKSKFDYNNGKPVIKRLAELDFNDDKEGKPINIHNIIGKKPVFAAGNSDGDLQMLQWIASNKYHSFMLYIHHTDAEREWAYDKVSPVGELDKGLILAKKDGWTLVDMKNEWKMIYPFESNE